MERRRYLQCVTGLVGGAAGVSTGTRLSGQARAQQATDGTLTQQAKLTATDGDPNDLLGHAVAVSRDGSTAVVASTQDEDADGNRAGAVYVFERSNGWTQRARLLAADSDFGDEFGASVDVSNDGSTVIVGNPKDYVSGEADAGSAYVFERTGGSWRQQARLVADDGDGGDGFGVSTAIAGDGTTAVVGAYREDRPSGDGTGAAYVFERAGGSWSQQTKLAADDGDSGDNFGVAVAQSADGSTAVVGAPFEEEPNGDFAGSAYVFERAGGAWSQQTKLAADDGDSGDNFGSSVAVAATGSTAVVGAPDDEDPAGLGRGSAYVFGQTAGTWTQRAKLSAADGDGDDQFGYSVGLSGDGSTALVGAEGDEDPNGEDAGSAYVFDRAGGSWRQASKLTAADGTDRDRFGSSVVVSGDGSTAIVGSRYDDNQNGEDAGSAYVFESESTGGLPTDDPGFQDVLGVIEAYNEGTTYAGVEVGFQDVLAVIEAYNSG